MVEVKNVLIVIGIICLTLFGIPIRISKPVLSDEEFDFQNFVEDFNKSYGLNITEYSIRFEHFKASLRLIDELNANRTKYSALYGLTKYSDLSRDEFRHRHLRLNNTHHHHEKRRDRSKDDSHEASSKKRLTRAIGALPAKMDWRERGVIGAVRNQKTCGACWAFSTVSTVESMNAIKTGKLETLSVQEVIDCAKNGNYGCEGGDSCTLLEWLLSNKISLQPEKSYPFTHITQTCRLPSAGGAGVQVQNYMCENFVNAEERIVDRLVSHGPVAVAVNAINWQYYLGGIIQFHCEGSPASLNHAVQLVGYDKTGAVPYFIARNSWGQEFGDKGYLYLAMGTNVCGLGNEVSSLDVV